MEVTDKLLAILFSLLILANGVVYRLRFKTWASPPALLSLFWFLYTFLPLVIIFDASVYWPSVCFIFIFIAFFSLPSLFFKVYRIHKSNCAKSEYWIRDIDPKPLLLTLFFLSVLGNIYQVLTQDISLSRVFTDILIVGGEMAAKRYEGEIELSLLGRVGMLSSYLLIILSGLFFYNRHLQRKFIYAIMAFIPLIIILLTQSQKGTVILGTFLFIGGILINRIHDDLFELFTAKVIRNLTLGLIPITLLIIASFFSRGLLGESDLTVLIDVLKTRLASYSFGHLYAFSSWFSAYTASSFNTFMNFDVSGSHYGKYTFMGIGKMLVRYKHEIPGVYDEFVFFWGDARSNIFTVFRGLIMDFGIIGSLIVAFGVGGIFSFNYQRLFISRFSPITITFYLFMVGLFYMSWIVSILTWAIIPLTFLVVFVLLSLFRHLRIKL